MEEACQEQMRILLKQGKAREALLCYREFTESCQLKTYVVHPVTLALAEEALAILAQQASPPAAKSRRHNTVWSVSALGLSVLAGIVCCTLAPSLRPAKHTTAPIISPHLPDSAFCSQEAYRLYQSAHYAEALAWSKKWHDLCVQQKDREGMASALIQMGQASVGLGELADSRSYYDEALSLRRETGSPLSVAAVLYTLGTLLVDTLDYEESHRYLTESMHIRKNERDTMGVLECQRGLGRLAAEQGHYAQAQEILQQAYAGAKREQKREMEMAVRAQMGMAALGERDTATARRWVTEGLEYWESRNHPDWIAEMERDLSQIAFAEGNIQEARRRAERSLSLYQKVGNQMGAAKSKYVLANALLRLGDTNQAEAYLLEALKYAGEKGLNRFPGGTWTWESPIIIL